MDSIYEKLQRTLETEGPTAALDGLCARLREDKDYSNLFYALLMKKRFELGVNPVPTAPAQSLPKEAHEPYENAIRDAGMLVGDLYLKEGNIPHAWAFYRMLGETAPVKQALETHAIQDHDDVHQLVDIAFNQGVHPTRGFDLVLDRFGICSSITMLGGGEFPHGPEVRDYCIKRLVRALYGELVERLKGEIERQQNFRPTVNTVKELIEGRDWLFGEDYYHIDVSHLGAVVQMSIHLQKSPELELARELCLYGQKLSPRFQNVMDPPFEDQYKDYAIYLAILAGDNVEAGLAHFRAKAERAAAENEGSYPAEVLVNLLLRVDRPKEALAVARQYLANVNDRRLACPGVVELCEQTGDYQVLAEVAREQNNPVHFMAGLLAGL